jgi:hypothetical protein
MNPAAVRLPEWLKLPADCPSIVNVRFMNVGVVFVAATPSGMTANRYTADPAAAFNCRSKPSKIQMHIPVKLKSTETGVSRNPGSSSSSFPISKGLSSSRLSRRDPWCSSSESEVGMMWTPKCHELFEVMLASGLRHSTHDVPFGHSELVNQFPAGVYTMLGCVSSIVTFPAT